LPGKAGIVRPLFRPRGKRIRGAKIMAKGRDRPGKEKKKPKSDKNKKPKHAPFGGKTPPTVLQPQKKP
jgi:hypothetical protein